MSPRVGMIVALAAAALLALAIAVPRWWAGHPTLDGKEFDRKTARIGLIMATQCNFADGEEYDCKSLNVGGSLAITKFIQLGFTGLAALMLLGLAFSRERRKGVGKLVLLLTAAGMVMAVVLLALGPNLKTGKDEAMPVGASFFLFLGGTLLAMISSVLAMLPARRPRVRTSHPSMIPAQQQPAFDMQALLAEDALRPAALGPEPMMGKAQSPGGMLAGPGPLIPQTGPQPMFSTAPQLRPLYEAGASGSFVPPPPVVQFPVRGPTPMPQAVVSATLGLEAPPPAPAPPPPAPTRGPPPPNRTKPMSAAPPIPAIPPPPRKPPPPRAAPTITTASVPPPPASRDSDPADRLATVGYEKNLLPTGDGTSPNAAPFDSSTSETATREFTNEDRTDAGAEDLETNAIEKVDPADVARPSKTEVELAKRTSGTDVEQARLSSAIMTSATPPAVKNPSVKVPISTAPTSLPPPPEAQTTGGPSPACPQCEAPMSWVEEHLRFYCKSCRMYF